MKLKEERIVILKEALSAELVEILMEEWNYSMDKAMEVLYNSDTFALIQDSGTGLYYQSAGYVFSFLENELKTGKCA